MTQLLQKKIRIEIWTFSFQICFQNQFFKLKIHEYAYTRNFSLTTSRSQKLILKADSKWEYPYFYSKFFFGAFWSVFKKVKKMDFPLYFQILRGRVPGLIFMLECNFFHQMPCINLLNNQVRRQTWSFDFWLLTQL